MSDDTGDLQADTKFKLGQSGNPAGRPKGSRNKFGEAFIEALYDDFKDHGVTAIQAAREADPMGYVRVCAGLLPKELKIEKTDELSDRELDERIRQLASIIGIEVRVFEPARGEETSLRH